MRPIRERPISRDLGIEIEIEPHCTALEKRRASSHGAESREHTRPSTKIPRAPDFSKTEHLMSPGGPGKERKEKTHTEHL